MKQLLEQHAKGQITLEELNKECAYWYLDCFSELHKKPLPSIPQKYQEYLNSTYSGNKEYHNNFWLMEDVKGYLDQKELIENENKSVLIHLRNYIKQIPREDFLSISKFNEKINELAEL